MPSNCSNTCLPRELAALNVVRYHQGTAKGLVESIGVCTKFAPIGYVIPGNARMFIPKNGSRYTRSSTRAPTTVEGTVARYQWLGRYDADEILPPFTPTFADDCTSQPSCSARRPCPSACSAVNTTSTRQPRSRLTTQPPLPRPRAQTANVS